MANHADFNLIFGDLREVLHGNPSPENFARACHIIELASVADPEKTIAELMPFASSLISRWPQEHRCLPERWLARWLEGKLPESFASLGGVMNFDTNLLLRDEDVGALISLSRLIEPVAFDANLSEITGGALERLWREANLTRVERFALHGQVDADWLTTFATHATFDALSALDLSGVYGAVDVLDVFDQTSWAANIRSLTLGNEGELRALVGCLALCDGLERVELHWATVSEEICELLAQCEQLTSLRHLSLDECSLSNNGMLALIRSPYIRNLETLSVVGNNLGSGTLGRLATSDLIDGVRVLRIGGNPVKPGGLRKLAKSKRLHALEEINLYNYEDDYAGAFIEELARNPVVTSLRVIEANNNFVTDAQGRALLERDDLGELEHLEASFWHLEPDTWRALFSSKLGRKIKHLDIISTKLRYEEDDQREDERVVFEELPDDVRFRLFRYETWGDTKGLGRSLAAPAFSQLESLELEYLPVGEATEAFTRPPLTETIRFIDADCGAIDEDTLIAMLSDGCLTNIEMLKVDRCGLTERTIDALIAAEHIRGLRHICFWDNKLGDAAAKLFSSHHMRSLEEIYLNGVGLSGEALAKELGKLDFDSPLRKLGVQSNPIGDKGASAIATNPHLPYLGTCYLYGGNIGESGVIALANSPNLKRVSYLHLGNKPGSEEGREALIESPYLPAAIRREWIAE